MAPSAPDTQLDETGEVTQAQLVRKAMVLGLDHPGGKEEDVANLCARLALDQELQDQPLAWMKRASGLSAWVA